MSLDIHPECKKRILEIVAEQLPHIVVNNKMFLERESCIRLVSVEESLPKKGLLKDQLEKYINEFPLYEFLNEALSKELYETQKYDKDLASVKLIEIEGYKDPLVVAERLIESFITLPWVIYLNN